MYETAAVSATEKCSLGAKIRKMSLQAYDSSRRGLNSAEFLLPYRVLVSYASCMAWVVALHPRDPEAV